MLLFLIFFVLISPLYSPLLCMKEEFVNRNQHSVIFYKTEDDPLITDACFLKNNKIAIATNSNEIRIFDNVLKARSNPKPLSSFQYRIINGETKNSQSPYIKHIFYNKNLLFVFSNKYIDEKMKHAIDMTIFTWTNWDKSVKSTFTFQNVSLLFFDAKANIIGLQSTDNTVRLKGISDKNEKIKVKNLYCDDKKETITNAAYNEKERLCLLAITHNALEKIGTFDSFNQSKNHCIKLISFNNHETLWQKYHHASHCVFNAQGTYFAYCSPLTRTVYIRDIFNKNTIFKGSLMVSFESLRALTFDKNNVIKEVTQESHIEEKTHYNKERSRTIIVTPESVEIELSKN